MFLSEFNLDGCIIYSNGLENNDSRGILFYIVYGIKVSLVEIPSAFQDCLFLMISRDVNKAGSLKAKARDQRLRSNSIVMACNCSLVQNLINPQQISKQSRTLPSFYYHIKYSWCKLKRNVSQMPILILLSFKILAARRIILTESYILFG